MSIFGTILGRVVAAPLRIINIPAQVLDAVGSAALGDDNEKIASAPIEAAAQGVEDAVKAVVDGDQEQHQ